MKHFNFLTTAALAFTLFAASSLAIHQSASAEGAIRIGGVIIGPFGAHTTRLVAGVAVSANVGAAAALAETACEDARREPNGAALAYTFTGNAATLGECDSASIPADTTHTDGVFTNACVVVIQRDDDTNISNALDFGVGIAANCETALSEAEADCTRTGSQGCANDGTYVVALNTHVADFGPDNSGGGPLYLIDGNAGVCPANEYDSANASNPEDFVCETATTNGNCEQNNPQLPILIGGTCEDTCPTTGEVANPADEAGCSPAFVPTNSQECLDENVNTPIFKGGSCEPAADDGECSSEHPTLPVLAQDGPGACRAQTQAECNLIPTTPILDDGACRSPTIAECFLKNADTPPTPILEDMICVGAESDNECAVASEGATTPLPFAATDESGMLTGACRAAIGEDCMNSGESPKPIFVNGACVAATAENGGACLLINDGKTPIPGVRGECRAATTDAECATTYPLSGFLERDANGELTNSGACQTPTAEICAIGGNSGENPTPILHEDGNRCRAAVSDEECYEVAAYDGRMPLQSNGGCIPATFISECETAYPTTMPLLDTREGRSGACRATADTECMAVNVQTPISTGGDCVAAVSDPQCVAAYPTLPKVDNRNVRENRAATPGACITCATLRETLPIYNAITENCQAATRDEDCADFNPEEPIAVMGENGELTGACRSQTAEEIAAQEDNSPVSASISGGQGNGNGAVFAGAIAVGLWLFYHHYTAGGGGISWTPSYAYNGNNGNITYSVGSRWTAVSDNMSFYWQTSHESSGEESIRYGSGISYNNGIFGASMQSASNLQQTDMAINLSAQKGNKTWHLSGGYDFDLRLLEEADRTETENRLNIAANYNKNRWQLSTNANTEGKMSTTGLGITANYGIDRWILSATANATKESQRARVDYSYRF